MKEIPWVDYIWTALLIILIVLVIIGGVAYEYVKFMAY